MRPELVVVGQITAPHGRTGEVRALPLTDFPERFQRTERLIVRLGGRESSYDVVRARPHKGFIVFKLAGVDAVSAAEKLRGAELCVPIAETVPLPAGRYYLFDIIGMVVCDQTGRKLGTISDVLQTGSNDVYVVRPEPGVSGRDILIPAIIDVVENIDVDDKVMTVNLIPGLIEEAASSDH